MTEPLAGNYFVSAYPPFSCWSAEALARFEDALQRVSEGTAARPFGLYVHVPFCVKRCRYCYYLSHEGRLGEAPAYVAALQREFELYMERPALRGRALAFAYFGGGTPSLLSVKQLEELFAGLQRHADWSGIEEATFECAPRSVTPEKMLLLRDAGITRLSLGVQQLSDDVLRTNDRVHSVADVLRAFETVRAADFPVVNLDFIVGLQGETEESFGRSLESAIALGAESLTFYQLEVPYNTPLYRSFEGRHLGELADWETKRARLARAFERLEQAGYALISGYAAVRDPVRHRFVYQDAQYRGGDLLGIGASSFSYLDGVHQQNLTRLTDYVACVQEGRLPFGRAYALTPHERYVREFLLQLKLGGVDGGVLAAKHGVGAPDSFDKTLERFRTSGWLKRSGQQVALTRDGLLRVDRLLPELYLPAHRVARYS